MTEEKALIALDDLVARIEQRESMDSIVRSVLPPGYRSVFQRLSLVRSFDRALYQSLLVAGIEDSPAFDDVVASDDVQPLPRGSDWFRLHPPARRRWFQSWWGESAGSGIGIPPELSETAERLVDAYRNAKNPLDELGCLVFVDQQQARELFDRLFDEAVGRFDLAGCRDALDAVGEAERERNRLLQPALKSDVDGRALHLRVRALWADDWYRTAWFLQPAGLREPFEQLLEGKPSRFLQLQARGGMGKTARLRWLIARWLVPERIPVTRIDFDVVDPLIATSDPWLVVLEMARQLSDQLPRGPFTELTADYARFLPLIYRSMGGAQAAATAFDIVPVRKRAASDVIQRFTAGINESAGPRHVVMIFDTMEEVLLRTSANLDALKEVLRSLHETCPALRVVFSSRYLVEDKAPAFADSFPGLVTAEVDPFTDDEASNYLHELRGIQRQDLVEVAVKQAGGLPFKLALFADVLQERPDIGVEDLRAYQDPDLLYLIERVVERIPSFGVRWLLRYGVIPRVLGRRTLKEFLAPYIARGMSGDSEFDEPHLDAIPRSRGGAVHAPFRTDREDATQLDPDGLWEQLRAYVASASWVSPEGADVVRFHTDVVNPMRRILRQQPAFATLNREARRYFSSLADREPDVWGPWMREAVHHALQLEGPAAVPYWADLIATAGSLGRLDWQRLLAMEVLDRATLGAHGERIPPDDGSELLPPETVTLAHFEVAAAYVEEARAIQAGAAHEFWSRGRSHLDAALAPAADPRLIPRERMALVSSSLLRRDAVLSPNEGPAKLEEAAELLRSASRSASMSTDRVMIDAALAEVLVDQGLVESATGLVEQVFHRRREWLQDPAGQRTAERVMGTAQLVARAAVERDRLDWAFRLIDGSAWISEPLSQAAMVPMAQLGAATDLLAGRPAGAEIRLSLGAFAAQDYTRQFIRQESLRARARLAAYRPTDALDIVRSALDLSESGRLSEMGPDEIPALQAELREVYGAALGAVAELRRSGEEFDRAIALWDQAGARDRAAGAACEAAAVQLWDAGDLNQASQRLDTADSLRPAPASAAWASARLLRAEVLQRLDADRSIRLLKETWAQLLESRAPPGRLAIVAISGLVVSSSDDVGGWIELLAEALGQILPEEVRLGYLDGLVRAPGTTVWAPAESLERLQRMVPDPEHMVNDDTGLAERDRVMVTLRSAEVDRVVGHPNRAAERLGTLRQHVDESSDPFLMVRVLQAANRLANPSLALLEEARLQRLRAALAGFPTTEGTLLIQQAHWRLLVDPLGAKHLVDRAEGLLSRGAEQRSVWQAEVFDVRAEVERRLGNTAMADYERGRANAVRERLGWPVGRPAPTEDGPPRITLTVRMESDRSIGVVGSLPGPGDDIVRGFGVEVPIVGDLLGMPVTDDTGLAEDVPMTLVASLDRDWLTFGTELGSLAFDPNWLQTPEPVDVAVQIAHRRLASVPWELMGLPSSELLSLHPLVATLFRRSSDQAARSAEARVVQSALNVLLGKGLPVDGLMGPASVAALQDFQRAQGLSSTGGVDRATTSVIRQRLSERAQARPLALVARPSFERQRARVRGEHMEASDAALVYDKAGFTVQLLEDPSPSALFEAIASLSSSKFPVAMIHLAAGITVSAGTLSLDFGEESRYEQGSSADATQLITTSTLDKMVQDAGRASGVGPIVILDVPRPSTETEAGRMLLLRNLFASDLFQVGNTRAVIATGLAQFGASNAQEQLLRTLGAGGSVADAARAVRELARDAWERRGFTEELAFAATALFAQIPWLGVASP